MKTSSSWLCKLKCRGEAKLAWLVCLGWVAPRFLLKIWRISSHWKYRGFLPIGNIEDLFVSTIVRISSLKILRISSEWKYWGFLPIENIKAVSKTVFITFEKVVFAMLPEKQKVTCRVIMTERKILTSTLGILNFRYFSRTIQKAQTGGSCRANAVQNWARTGRN